MTSRPVRIQLSRARGWRKPEGAIVVSRPSVLGNPFRVVDMGASQADERWRVQYHPNPNVDSDPRIYTCSMWPTRALAITDAVEGYRRWATTGPNHYWRVQCFIDDWKLAGHDLACWCPLDQPCHADVLLELANRSET